MNENPAELAALRISTRCFLFAAEPAGYSAVKSRRNDGERNRADRILHVAERVLWSFAPLRLVGESLASGEVLLNLVVHHDVSEVHVAAHGVYEMIAADAANPSPSPPVAMNTFNSWLPSCVSPWPYRQRAPVQRCACLQVLMNKARQISMNNRMPLMVEHLEKDVCRPSSNRGGL